MPLPDYLPPGAQAPATVPGMPKPLPPPTMPPGQPQPQPQPPPVRQQGGPMSPQQMAMMRLLAGGR
jgi:hypothetical protein